MRIAMAIFESFIDNKLSLYGFRVLGIAAGVGKKWKSFFGIFNKNYESGHSNIHPTTYFSIEIFYLPEIKIYLKRSNKE